VASGYLKNPYQGVRPAEAALLRSRYRISAVKHVPFLTAFLLTRAPAPGRG
jgi:hypothetical protein